MKHGVENIVSKSIHMYIVLNLGMIHVYVQIKPLQSKLRWGQRKKNISDLQQLQVSRHVYLEFEYELNI